MFTLEKTKLIALGILAAVAAILGIRAVWVAEGRAQVKEKIREKRIEEMQAAKEIDDAVRKLPDGQAQRHLEYWQ